ncbi:m7GpppX diphosphatase [Geosmithia morbida]|uniref:M7GpppX diphosphatase n=1 Tax=Geosmithia morbida TaxID=1094350 RepID=A0A9P4Z162_9HYPO|nr:m7GpppX diphosphatase [Geosmithia morbida]KAF4126801.1 m7GpppX diphosphatase [Geosmithia morbida]
MSDRQVKADAEALVPQFKLDRVLNQDQAGRRTSILGTINSKQALLVLERAPFPSSAAHLASIPVSLARLRNLGANDVYNWYMARTGTAEGQGKAQGGQDDESEEDDGSFFADLKINLIYPCTETHIKKYSKQGVRFVTETPEIYAEQIRPYIQAKREQGRLNWVFNILDGKTEVEDVIYRTQPWGVEPAPASASEGSEGFLLLPDLNWDRSTMDALHLLALVERRDLWSLRDLRKKHVGWLRRMRRRLVDATVATYPCLEADQLKLYLHYQPTYYHLHVHIVHVALEAGATQATGKAVGLDSIIETLEVMGGDGEAGMDRLAMSYTIGEASELWEKVYEPLKRSQQ